MRPLTGAHRLPTVDDQGVPASNAGRRSGHNRNFAGIRSIHFLLPFFGYSITSIVAFSSPDVFSAPRSLPIFPSLISPSE
jgi:hypothetical protein